MDKPRVLIYRSELLPTSNTFISAQAHALRGFEPLFAGLRRVPDGLPLPWPQFVLTEGDRGVARARRFLYQHAGYAPGWVEAMRAAGPALLHAHFALDAAEALPLARALGLPLIVTLHGYDVMTGDAGHRATRRGRLYLRRRPQLFRDTHTFLCVSEAIRQKALERGFPPGKLRVHWIGIDGDLFTPRERPVAEPVVLFVGRLVEKKGCVHLLRAMASLRRHLPAARLVVLGDGPERAMLEQKAQAMLPGTLFLGAQTSDVVRQWMRAARVLALPSITAADGDAEGLPTVLCEALASALPVAAFASSGIPELARDGQEALLAAERDEDALAVNLLRLCTDDELARRLGENGRRRVTLHCNLQTQTGVLEQFYGQAMHASGTTASSELPWAPAHAQRGEA